LISRHCEAKILSWDGIPKIKFPIHDRLLKRRTRRKLCKMLPMPNQRILDVCCGTGDLSRELSRRGPVVGVDFASDMLTLNYEKMVRNSAGRSIIFLEGDGLALPVRSMSSDAVTAAFGIRNFENLRAGLQEMMRVLRIGVHWPFWSFRLRSGRLFQSDSVSTFWKHTIVICPIPAWPRISSRRMLRHCLEI
jgi:ubiquinone/menaquinone biosynthesis C-methylase UbiE